MYDSNLIKWGGDGGSDGGWRAGGEEVESKKYKKSNEVNSIGVFGIKLIFNLVYTCFVGLFMTNQVANYTHKLSDILTTWFFVFFFHYSP